MKKSLFALLIAGITCSFCNKESNGTETPEPIIKDTVVHYTYEQFCMGADLSYVNQILDHGGVFKDSGINKNPYKIFKDHGTNLVRVRIWNNPSWTKDPYGAAGTQLYSDLRDVEKTIRNAREHGMAVNLDFHYSDIWADPGNQKVPAAWKDIKDTSILKDSVYNFTFKTLQYLNSKGLMPEMVQIGNEINCGLFYSEAPAGFPSVSCCNGNWKELGAVLNAGIKAVRTVSAVSPVKTKIMLHVADPKNVEWWFDNIMSQAKVTDFEVIGFSYYPLWHTTVSFNDLGTSVSSFKSKYKRQVMIAEVAYPWSTSGNDSYNNAFGSQPPVSGYPFTTDGQYNFMVALTQKVISAGGSGIMYWEPAWITSQMKDLWGTGSSWENATFFDFTGNTIKGINYMNYKYIFPIQ